MGSTRPSVCAGRMSTNHSHVCGINVRSPPSCSVTPESFPRMWDQLARAIVVFKYPRIIPTYVGSTNRCTELRNRLANHSHVRGINDLAGSTVLLLDRIIPTYVGSTTVNDKADWFPANHSHVCGINWGIVDGLIFDNESFPRMWDQLFIITLFWLPRRIIPTYVGSTLADSEFRRIHTNHSHVCGINAPHSATSPASSESFPRMWDQLIVTNDDGLQYRIIPTYVGSTSRWTYVSYHRPNHSHVCGINCFRTVPNDIQHESFPRMWDQRYRWPAAGAAGRIIPTYVGSTVAKASIGISASNHSHVCGINWRAQQ